MEVPEQLLSYDNFVMLGVSLLLIPFVFFKRDVTRVVGIGLIGIYVAYAVSLVA